VATVDDSGQLDPAAASDVPPEPAAPGRRFHGKNKNGRWKREEGTEPAVIRLLMARTKDFDKDDAGRVAAAMSGVQSLSRSLGSFCEDGGHQWRQTLVQFDGGWVFLISAGDGAYLGVSAEIDPARPHAAPLHAPDRGAKG
jgi:hypothetical protein